MGTAITILVIFAISAVANLLKKAGQDRSGQMPGGAPPPRTPPAQTRPVSSPQPRSTSWEEELRRLLDGQTAAAPPVRPVRPPVVVMTPQPQRPPPAPVVIAQPVTTVRSFPAPAISRVEAPPMESAQLSQSNQAYERASRLDIAVAEHMGRVPGQRVLATTVWRREASAEIGQVVSLFKTAAGARQAVMASIILGPPRALEPGSVMFEG